MKKAETKNSKKCYVFQYSRNGFHRNNIRYASTVLLG